MLDSAQYISHGITFAIRSIKTVRKPRLEIISVVYAFIMRAYLFFTCIYLFFFANHATLSHLSPEVNFNFVEILLRLICTCDGYVRQALRHHHLICAIFIVNPHGYI